MPSTELYMVEPIGDAQVLLTTEMPEDPSPPGFGFLYDADTSLLPDGKTRVLGYVRPAGDGAVAYVALGHCHSRRSNTQPFVDETVARHGENAESLSGQLGKPRIRDAGAQRHRLGRRWNIRAQLTGPGNRAASCRVTHD